MNPRLGDALPQTTEKQPGGSAAGVPFGESTLQERLKKGQFAFAGKGVQGPYGDRSEGAAEAFTLLAKDNVDESGIAHFMGHQRRMTRLQLEPEIAASLPQTDYPVTMDRSYRSCAIVGNSGTMLSSRQGAEIDAHEAVMRINYAPIKGFEADVGSKTTFDFSNRENARRILKFTPQQWRNSTLLFFEVSSPTNRNKMFVPLTKKHTDREIHFIHPGFVVRAMDLWFDFKSEVEARRGQKYHDKPMSGFMAIMFMMQICRQVDLYGFEAYTKKRANSPYHYFDDVQGVVTVHSFDMAVDIYRMLGEVYPLSIK